MTTLCIEAVVTTFRAHPQGDGLFPRCMMNESERVKERMKPCKFHKGLGLILKGMCMDCFVAAGSKRVNK
jgi:hypothetical protein